MKVVLFCGGLGVRMGSETHRIPKPMIRIGERPIVWHIMRYFLAWGHNEFIVCLGHKGDVIREYFLQQDGALFNDFTMRRNGDETSLEIFRTGTPDWSVTFVDTGLEATVGERLKRVEPYLEGEDEFLATYGDGLVDAPLSSVIDAFRASGRMIQFLSVRPEFNAHLVTADDSGTVLDVRDMSKSAVRINGGYFVCKHELLDVIEPGDELVEETLSRLIPRGEVGIFEHDGFFGPMDTIKDRQRLQALYESGSPPWEAWRAAEVSTG